jgi:cellulose biosynthesis protein BcsQ
MSGITVMEGSLDDFDVADILGVLGLSRQYTRLELYCSDGGAAGAVFMKSGKVVQAVCGALLGREAFLSLIALRLGAFRVVRVEMPALVPEPIDTLTALLIEAASRADEDGPDTTRMDTHEEEAFELRSHPAFRSLMEEAQDRATPVLPSPSFDNLHGHGTAKSGMRPVAASAGRVVAVCSPKGGAGKTTVALNLALALTRRGLDVILVDGDINGDILGAVDARAAVDVGVFDVLSGFERAEDALRGTVIPNLRIVPSLGTIFPEASVTIGDHTEAWQKLLSELARHAAIVIVDTPAGMFGMTHQILRGATDVIGVLPAEVLATRSFSMFNRSLESIQPSERPALLGVALNMIDGDAATDVVESTGLDVSTLAPFSAAIPRSDVFGRAASAGVPVLLFGGDESRAVSSLFDALSTEVIQRLGARSPDFDADATHRSVG